MSHKNALRDTLSKHFARAIRSTIYSAVFERNRACDCNSKAAVRTGVTYLSYDYG